MFPLRVGQVESGAGEPGQEEAQNLPPNLEGAGGAAVHAPRGQGWGQEKPSPAQSHCPQMGRLVWFEWERAPCLWRRASGAGTARLAMPRRGRLHCWGLLAPGAGRQWGEHALCTPAAGNRQESPAAGANQVPFPIKHTTLSTCNSFNSPGLSFPVPKWGELTNLPQGAAVSVN